MERFDSLPVTVNDRLVNIDIIRGIALLGILIMNIQSFSMIFAAYSNPTAYGDLTGINYWVFYFSHVFANQKFMTIFAILFGTGIVLMAENIDKKQGKSTKIHFKRMFILAVLGCAHAYLLWFGDILLPYAISGMIAYSARKKSARFLLIIGFVLITLCSLMMVGVGASLPYFEQADLDAIKLMWSPSAEDIDKELQSNLASWLGQMDLRHYLAAKMQTNVIFYCFRIIGLMFIGMALFKLDFFGKRFTNKALLITGIVAVALSIFVIDRELTNNFANGWPLEAMFNGTQGNYWCSILMAFGYMCLLMVFSRLNVFNSLKNALASVGKLALTNYLSQTIICCFIFYGWGLGYFGQLERIEQLAVVFGVWVFQLSFSSFWLTRFKFGPFEWVMRSLTYGYGQSIRKS